MQKDSLYLSSKPAIRSRLRLFLGKNYYMGRRYLRWLIHPSVRYAKTMRSDFLPYAVMAHHTPLYRPLRNVDHWLQENKVINLKLAVKKIDGLVLKPGETLSLWRRIGKPSKIKGYRQGMVLTNGSFTAGTGGGLCQLSNLVYWLTLHTPLTVTERWRHTHDVFPDVNRTLPFGSGATIVYNYVDLQIKNETAQAYQLLAQVDDTELKGEWRAEQPPSQRYEVYESAHRITQEWWGGYMRHNEIRRRVFMEERQTGDEWIVENHAVMMYEPLLGEGEAAGSHPLDPER